MADCQCRWCIAEPGHAGSRSRYRSGCRCDACREVEAERNRAARAKRAAARDDEVPGSAQNLPPDSAPGGAPPASPAAATGGIGLAGALRGEFLFFGTLISGADPVCGGAIVRSAPELARNLDELARQDPAVYRWLTALSAPGGWGGVAVAALPIAQAVISHHVVPLIVRARNRREELDEGQELYDEGPGDEELMRYDVEEAGVPSSNGAPLGNPSEFAGP